MTRLVLGFLSLAIASVSAAADAPTGFADIPWGTPSYKVADAMSGRCVFVRRTAELATCGNYEIPTVGRAELRFMFATPAQGVSPSDGTLDGYRIIVDSTAYQTFRALALERFGTIEGRSQAEGYEMLTWRWPQTGPLTVAAYLLQRCGSALRSCINVSTAGRAAKEAEAQEEARQKARKSF